MRTFYFITTFSILLLTACNFHKDKLVTDPVEGKFDFTDRKLDYQTVNEFIFQPKCLECHNGEETDYRNYQAIADSLKLGIDDEDSIWYRIFVAEKGRMPKNRPALSPCAKELLTKWVEAQFPEFSDLPLPADFIEACSN